MLKKGINQPFKVKKLTALLLIPILLLISILFITSYNFTGGTTVDKDSCSSLEGAAKDDCYLEARTCSKIKNSGVRDSCVAELAKAKQDLTVCDLIKSEQTKGFCQEQLAEIKNDVKICEQITDAYWINNCYLNLGIKNNKDEFCLSILDRDQEMECHETIALSTNDYKLCDLLPVERKDICLGKIAKETLKLGVCDGISVPISVDACRLKVVKLSNDKELCTEIKTSVVRDACNEFFAGK